MKVRNEDDQSPVIASKKKSKQSIEDAYIKGAITDNTRKNKVKKRLRSKPDKSIGLKLFNDEYEELMIAISYSEINQASYIRKAITAQIKKDKLKRERDKDNGA